MSADLDEPPSSLARWAATHSFALTVTSIALAVSILVLTVVMMVSEGPGQWWRCGSAGGAIAMYIGVKQNREAVTKYDAEHRQDG